MFKWSDDEIKKFMFDYDNIRLISIDRAPQGGILFEDLLRDNY
jgi:hypothetical protein